MQETIIRIILTFCLQYSAWICIAALARHHGIKEPNRPKRPIPGGVAIGIITIVVISAIPFIRWIGVIYALITLINMMVNGNKVADEYNTKIKQEGQHDQRSDKTPNNP